MARRPQRHTRFFGLALATLALVCAVRTPPARAQGAGSGGTASGSALWEEAVPLQTLPQKVDVLLGINRVIPQLLSNAVNYDRDPLEVLHRQAELWPLAQNQAEFHPLRSDRGLLKDLFIGQESDVKVTARELAPDTARVWKSQLAQALAATAGKASGDLEGVLQAEIAALLRAGATGRSQGILTGLIQLLPADRRGEIFRASFDSQLAVLKAGLPPELIKAGFRAANFGWSETTLSREEGLRRLAEAKDSENRLVALAELHLVLQDRDGRVAENLADARAKLGALGEADLVKLMRDEDLKAAFAALKARLAAKDPSSEKAAKALLGLVSQHASGLAAKQVSVSTQVSGRLLLREVPPVVGLFRGFAGNDCSTEQSFAFVNSPAERVFLVLDAATKGVKGYAAATHVLTEHGPTLYLHTINGPRISASDAHLIVGGLRSQLKAFGARVLALPPADRIRGMVNYGEIREALEALAEPGSRVRLTYVDPALRLHLKMRAGIRADYDDPAKNSVGRLVKSSHPSWERLAANVNPSSMPALTGAPLDKPDLLLLLLSLRKSGRSSSQVTDEILKLGGFQAGQVTVLANALNNQRQMPSAEYFRSLVEHFGALGVPLTENFIEANWGLFVRGHLAAPDFKAPQNLRRTVQWVSNAITLEMSDVVESAFARAPDLIVKNSNWTERILKSEQLAPIFDEYLMSHMELLEGGSIGHERAAQARARISAAHPRFLPLHEELSKAPDVASYLQAFLKHGLASDPDLVKAVESTATRFLGLGPTVEQIRAAAEQVPHPMEAMAILRIGFPLVRTAEQFVAYSAYTRAWLDEAYRREYTKVMIENTDRFLALRPSPEQVRAVAARMSNFDAIVELQKRAAQQARTADEYTRALEPIYADNRHYRAKLGKAAGETAGAFFALAPGPEQVERMSKALSSPDTKSEFSAHSLAVAGDAATFLARAQVKSLTPEQRSWFLRLDPKPEQVHVLEARLGGAEAAALFAAALDDARTSARFAGLAGAAHASSGESRAMRARALAERLPRFMAMNPTAPETRTVLEELTDAASIDRLTRFAIPRAASAGEYLLLTEPIAGLREPEYERVLHKILFETAESFLAFGPTPAQGRIMALRVNSVHTTMRIARTTLARVSTAEEFLMVTESYFPNPSQAYREELRALALESFDRFFSLEPTLEQARQYALRFGAGEGTMKVMEAMVPRLKGAVEFARLAEFPGPGAAAILERFLVRHWDSFLLLDPSRAQIDEVLARVTDRKLAGALRLRSVDKLTGVEKAGARLRIWLQRVNPFAAQEDALDTKPSSAPRPRANPAAPFCEALFRH